MIRRRAVHTAHSTSSRAMIHDDSDPNVIQPTDTPAGAAGDPSDDVRDQEITGIEGKGDVDNLAQPPSASPSSALTAPADAAGGVPSPTPAPSSPREPKKPRKKVGNKPNLVRQIRIERMMSKAELARSANLSVLTIDRVEKGFGCRVNTKRKILEALGLSLADRVRVFGEEE